MLLSRSARDVPRSVCYNISMPHSRPKFVIFDGNALIHRAFHALPPTMQTKDGRMTNAVYGFTTIMFKVLKELKPAYVAVSFDVKGSTFRHEKFDGYKATRVKKPQELYDQIITAHDVVRAFNIPIYEKKGFEADDVIGTLVKQTGLAAHGVDSVIVSGDLDSLQLVDERTFLYTLKGGLADTIVYGPVQVKERYGLTPDQMIDFKALRGDPSDNIPGVAGIGEKGASTLLQTFGTLDALYDALEKQTPKAKKLPARLQEKLIAGKKDALMSRELATIVTNLDLDFSLKDAVMDGYDESKVFALFQDLQFKSLLSRLPKNVGAEAKGQIMMFGNENGADGRKTNKVGSFHGQKGRILYELVHTSEKFDALLKNLANVKSFAIDTEGTSQDPMRAALIGISLAWKAGEAYYISFPHLQTSPKHFKALQKILADPSIAKIGHNVKFDLKVLRRHDLDLSPIRFDTKIAAYLLNPGSRNTTLGQLAFTEFGYTMQPITDLIGKRGPKQITMDKVDLEKVAWYAAEDADFTWRLSDVLRRELDEKNCAQLFKDIEMPLVPVLAGMEMAGAKINVPFLQQMEKKLTRRLHALEDKIYDSAGTKFNINSPIQLRGILFTKLKISTDDIRSTKTGLSTAAAELEKMRGQHKMVDLLLEYRELAKLLSTYITALPKLINPESGRVHTNYSQTIAATGRLSSSDPNLQNIPIRTELGREIRKAFVAERGQRLLSIDYSQIELRIVASLAGDKKMLEWFHDGRDVHTMTAAEINTVPLDHVTPEMRYAAKEVNFGVIYGMGVFGLAERTGIGRERAKEFIDRYFELHEPIRKYLENTKTIARAQGYVETLFHRRRYLPDLNSGVVQLRNAAERMAVNHPIQGTAADLMKLAMIEVANELPKMSAKTKMLLQVHDELVFELPEREVAKVAREVAAIMESVVKLDAPVIAEAKVGTNWGDMEKL